MPSHQVLPGSDNGLWCRANIHMLIVYQHCVDKCFALQICNYVCNLCSFRHVCNSNKKMQSLKSVEFTLCDIHGCVRELGNHFCNSQVCVLRITKPLQYIVNYPPPSYCQHDWFHLFIRSSLTKYIVKDTLIRKNTTVHDHKIFLIKIQTPLVI